MFIRNANQRSNFPDEIVGNPNGEEVITYLKNLTKGSPDHSNFPYHSTNSDIYYYKGNELATIIPKGAGCYESTFIEFDFADKAKRGVGFNAHQTMALMDICSIGIVHLCYLERTNLFGPIKLIEIKGACKDCPHSWYMKYEKHGESEIFKMFKSELPEIYEKLKKEYRKKIKRGY